MTRSILAIAVTAIALCAAHAAPAVPTIVPLKVVLRWPGATGPIAVKTPSGKTVYNLWLDPAKDDAGRTTEIDLVLSPDEPGSDDARNLLEPPGNWHGVQQFMFIAWDASDYADVSRLGPRRDFGNAQAPLKVTATIIQNVLVPTPPGSASDHQFSEFELQVEIDNPK